MSSAPDDQKPSPEDEPRRALPASAAAPVLGYAAPPGPARSVTAAFCANPAEAELVAGDLAAEGIPSQVLNAHTAVLGPYGGGSRIEVQVLEADAARAAEVMARRAADPDELEP